MNTDDLKKSEAVRIAQRARWHFSKLIEHLRDVVGNFLDGASPLRLKKAYVEHDVPPSTPAWPPYSKASTFSMGEAKLKLNRRARFLETNPLCVYCGGAATTSDHCPPRSMFEGRHWPETYEFPACEPCNAAARLDEQALAVLLRVRLSENKSATGQQEWERLLRGVRNNQPQVLAEWKGLTRNETKQRLRDAFGSEGDLRRKQGWGVANVGPLTQAMITRFMIKLAKSLYYRHNEHVFDGVLYVQHINMMSKDTTPEYINSILHMAPALPQIERNRKPLAEQFIYRFNHSPEHGVMYAVVQFGEQFIFQLIAMGREMDAKLVDLQGGEQLSKAGRHECFLLPD